MSFRSFISLSLYHIVTYSLHPITFSYYSYLHNTNLTNYCYLSYRDRSYFNLLSPVFTLFYLFYSQFSLAALNFFSSKVTMTIRRNDVSCEQLDSNSETNYRINYFVFLCIFKAVNWRA